MSEESEFFHTRISDGRVPLFVFEDSLFFPDEKMTVSYRYRTGSLLDFITSPDDSWKQYLKKDDLIICTSRTTESDKDAKIFSLAPYEKGQVYKVGTAAVVTNITEPKKGELLIEAQGLGKAEIWQLADSAKLPNKPSFYLVERFGVFKSQMSDRQAMATALKPFAALVQRLLKLDILSVEDRKLVLESLTQVPDPVQAITTEPGELVEMLHAVMYRIGKALLKPNVATAELQKMLGEPYVEFEVAMFNMLLQQSIMAHLSPKDPSASDPAKSGSKGRSDKKDEDLDGDDNVLRRTLYDKLKDKMNPVARKAIARALKRVEKKSAAQDLEEVKWGTWLDMALHLPWDTVTVDRQDLKEAKGILDTEHAGMEDVKERVLDFLAQRQSNPVAKLPILCLVGPAGTGKTSLGKSIARATNRNYVRLAVGGVHDESVIRGHSFTYVGSKVGRVIKEIYNSGSKNTVCIIDEVDKMQATHGDPQAALMEALDPEQNAEFEDHYLGFPFDLSQVLFICTANNLDTIHRPLLDRMFVIKIPGYFEHEKVQIVTRHLARRAEENVGLSVKGLKLGLSEEVIRKIITEYTFEPGVRDIGRLVEEIARKLNRAILEGRIDLNAISDGTLVVPPQDVEKYLGDVKVEPRRAYETVYGESFGLSVMEHEGAVLGDILPIHARLVPGRHAKEASFTGRLGESMKESAKIALSCARNFLEEHGMKAELELLNDSLIHISTANGAQPKDGPSAGLALFSAILSAVTKRPLLPMMAMTGELELTERVTKVGGIKGKVLAAERARLKGVVLPKENEKDFNQLPQVVRDKIKVYPVANIHEALPILFGDDFPPKTV